MFRGASPRDAYTAVAKMAGLPRTINHGMCTMAIATKGAVDKLAGGDPHAYLLRALDAAIQLPGAVTYPEDLLNATS